MNFLKTIFVTAALGAVGYGVWVALYSPLPEKDDEELALAPGWDAAPAPAVDAAGGPVVEAAPAPYVETIAPPIVTEQTVATSVATSGPAQAVPDPYAVPSNQTIDVVLPEGYGASAPAPSVSLSSISSTDAPASPVADAAPAPTVDVAASSPDAGASQFAATMQEVNSLLANQRLDEALLALSQYARRSDLTPAEQETLNDLLGQLAGTVIYSREYEMEPHYVVRAGETIESIAESCQVPAQLLMKINGLTAPAQLREGDKLKILRGPFNAVVDLRLRECVLFLQGRYAGRFAISAGSDLAVTEGDFHVSAKQLDPTFISGTTLIGAGDPRNPLGKYWLALNKPNEIPGATQPLVGIHGAADASASSPAGGGYIRLAPAEIVDVYDILSVGSRVTLRR